MIIVFLLAGVALLCFGANYLTDGAVAIARRFRLSELAIGVTIVAVGTSMPELTVSVLSSIEGNSDVAIGNIVGSNTFNVFFILGITALIAPVAISRLSFRRDNFVALAVSILLTVLLFGATLGLGGVNRLSRLDGVLLLLLYGGYLFWIIRSGRTTEQEQTDSKPVRTWLSVLMIVGGLVGLILGAQLFLDGAVALARRFGVEESTIALILVAGGTSLPELATTLVASLKGRNDVAIGNILGSNISNILLILGISAVIMPLQAGGIKLVDLLVMISTSLFVLVAALVSRPMRIGRVAGLFFLAAYVGYVFMLLR